MATRLEGAATARSGRHLGRGPRRLADAAARTCLDRAGVAPGDIDLLINAGIYHERLLGEPALAALIQEDIAAHPEDPHPGDHGTFSFDVANGACGMLTALEVADGFLGAGTVRHALVVASDGDPGHRLAPGFPFDRAASALVCSRADGEDGSLSGFRFASRPGPDLRAVVRGGSEGRNHLTVIEDEGHRRAAAALAAEVATACLDDAGLAAGEVVVVANPLHPDFLDALATGLGVAGDRVVRVPGAERVHTAALGLAVEALLAREPEAGTACLLVSAGAGLTAGAALWRTPAPARG